MNGVCARGGFELNFRWKNNELTQIEVLSKSGKPCRIKVGKEARVFLNQKEVDSKPNSDGSIEFSTLKGSRYSIEL